MTTTHLTDTIVRQYTAFASAWDMLTAMGQGYVPTVSARRQGALLLALEAQGLPYFELP